MEVTKIKKKIFYIIGGPATGRTTTCQKYAQENGWDHISLGQQLRDEVDM